MAKLLDMKSATITSKGQISLPKEVRKKAGFKTGSKVIVMSFDDRVELRPIERISEAMYASLMSEKSLAKIWLTPEEDEAWKHL